MDGGTAYPDNKQGHDAIPGTVKETELQPGDVVTRYKKKKYGDDGQPLPYKPKDDSGSYVSKGNEPFENRSLPGKESDYTKETFVVKKPIPATESKATPWFDKKGAGNQVETQKGIDKLIDDGLLEHVGSD